MGLVEVDQLCGEQYTARVQERVPLDEGEPRRASEAGEWKAGYELPVVEERERLRLDDVIAQFCGTNPDRSTAR